MAAPFQPPSAEHKDPIDAWIPPPATKLDRDWAELHTIELSLLDSPDPEVVAQLIETCKISIKEDGFLYLTNYGVSLEQLHRQFAIAQYMHRNISEEDKQRLHWDPAATGLYSGYKPPFGWTTAKGSPDQISHFNFYRRDFASMDRIPTCLHPYWDEVIAFCEYLTQSVNRRLLKLLSLVLELPDDYLFDRVQSHGCPVAEGYLRYALYSPMEEATRVKAGGVRMNGHCDYGTTTMLFSVPVSSLQIWQQDRWRTVKYSPGALVINIGQTLELLSGGHFRATLHKVVAPPEDQSTFERLSIVLFNSSQGDLRMEPCFESPLIQREGLVDTEGAHRSFQRLRAKGMPVPTNKEWREINIAESRQPIDKKDWEDVTVNGIPYQKRVYMGAEILTPA